MEWSNNDLEEYIKRPQIAHDYYKSEKKIISLLLKIYKMLKF